MSGCIRCDISLTSVQAFVVFLPGQGWNVGSIPIIHSDWGERGLECPAQAGGV
jgi:hypothetical protein